MKMIVYNLLCAPGAHNDSERGKKVSTHALILIMPRSCAPHTQINYIIGFTH